MSQLGGGIKPDNWGFWSYSPGIDNGPDITAKIDKALSSVGEQNYTAFFRNLTQWEWTSNESYSDQAIYVFNDRYYGYSAGTICFVYNSGGRTQHLGVRPFLAF